MGRCWICRLISSALCPSTTITLATELSLSAPTIFSIKVWPSIGSSALGRPIRDDSPAERTTATIMAYFADRRCGQKSPLTHLFQRGAKLARVKYPPLAKGDRGGFFEHERHQQTFSGGGSLVTCRLCR